MSCPCGSGQTFDSCCGPIISGAKKAETAEALMRARYTSYTKCDVDFLMNSLHSSGDADRATTEAWARAADWHSLEVLSTKQGTASDELGEVEFAANFSIRGQLQRHHEIASFQKTKGEWKLLDGKEQNGEPVRGPAIALGRNDACPCTSGKKFKKCCGPVLSSGASDAASLARALMVAFHTGAKDFVTLSLSPEARLGDAPYETGSLVKISSVDVVGDKPAQVTVNYVAKQDGKETAAKFEFAAVNAGARFMIA